MAVERPPVSEPPVTGPPPESWGPLEISLDADDHGAIGVEAAGT